MDGEVDIPIQHSPYTPLGAKTDEKAEAKADVLAQTPVLKTLLSKIDKDIALLENYGNLPDKILLDTELFMHTVAARKIAISQRKKDRDYLQKQIDLLS